MDRSLDYGGYNLAVPLYTIVPLDMVLTQDQAPLVLTEKQRSDGTRLLLRDDGTLERLISTDPAHYLSPDMRPGIHLS